LILSGINNFSTKTNSENFTLLCSKIVLLTILAIWILGFLKPIILFQNNILTDYFLSIIYSKVCHQVDFKCITIEHESMLVCARCAGIYSGVFISVIFMLFRKVSKLNVNIFIVASIPLVADVFLTNLNVYNYSHPLAFITGLVFGGMLCLFFLSELENLFLNKSINRNE
jgi:uncharacterized membrane protein